MPVYGEYETVAELGRGASTCVYRARPADGGWDLGFEDLGTDAIFALKTFRVRNAEDAGGVEISRFLERVRAQKRVTTSGAMHWAPIIDTGKAGPDAYYIAPYYPRTAAKVAQTPGGIDSDSLYGIVIGTLEGLLELRKNQGRPHGNLKSTNILIKGVGKIASTDIQLTDPAREEDATIAGEVEDLFNLGEIIHELVLGTKFAGQHTWPIKPSRQWAQLGKKANQWLAICNHLLSPRAAENWLRVDDVFEEVAALRPTPRRIGPRKLWIAAAASIVVAGLCVGEYFRYTSQWRELCADYPDGVGALSAQLAQLTPKELAADSYINDHVVRPLAEARDKNIELDPRGIARSPQPLTELAEHPPLSPGVIWKTEKAWRIVRNVEKSLSADQWKDLAELTTRKSDYEKRGWTRLAQYTGTIADLGKRPQQGDWLTGIAGALEGHGRLARLESARTAARSRMEHLAVRSQATPMAQDHIAEFQGMLRACAESDVILPSAIAVDRLTQQINEIETISARFDDQVSMLAEAAKRQRAYEVRGWTTPARSLAALIDRARPDADLVRLGVELSAAQKFFEQVEAKWASIETRRRLFDTSGDRILSTYREFIAQARLGEQADLASLDRRLGEINDDAAWIAAAKIVSGPEWAKLDVVEFARRSDAHKGFSGHSVATPQILRLWLTEVEAYGPMLSTAAGNTSNDPRVASAQIKPDRAHNGSGEDIKRPIETVPRPPTTIATVTPTTNPSVNIAQKNSRTDPPAPAIASAQKTATTVAVVAPATKPAVDLAKVQREKEIAAFVTESREVALSAKTRELKDFWRAKNDQLAERVTKDHTLYTPQLRSHRDQLRSRLLQLDTAWLTANAALSRKPTAAAWSAPLVKSLQNAIAPRNDSLKELAALADASDTRFDAALSRLADDDEHRRASAAALLADASKVDELLAQGYTPADKSAASALAAIRASDLYKIDSVRQSLEPLIKPTTVVESESTATTLRLLASSADLPLGVRLAAWSKIQGTVTTENLTSDLKLANELQSDLQKAITDKTRSSTLKTQFESDLRTRWQTLLDQAKGEQDIEAALALREQIPGVNLEKLSARARVNLALRDFRAAVASAKGDDIEKQLAPAAQKLKTLLADLDSADAKQPQLLALSAELDRIGHPAAIDFTELGPMSQAARQAAPKVTWSAIPEESGDKVTYRASLPTDAGLEEVALVFRRVHPSAAQSSWVCTTETSLGVFCDLLTASGKWTDVRSGKLLPDYDPMRGDPRVGPRTWEWPRYGRMPGVVRALVWLGPDFVPPRADHYPDTIGSEFNRSVIRDAQGERSEEFNPSRRQPVQQVSAKAAQLAAAAAGCRIPTIAEWQAAWHVADERATGNVRDRMWRLELEHMDRPAFKGRCRPDAGIFTPGGEKQSDAIYTKTDGGAFDDGILWFHPVTPASPNFVDLVGNVAEFVSDDAGKVYVIGGSAMSPPARPLDRPFALAVDQQSAAFSDTGFRLAFSAPVAGIENLKTALAGNWYVAAR